LLAEWPYGGGVVALIADGYLILMLWSATMQSSKFPETWPGLPMRLSAVVVVPVLFATLVLAFAAVYRSKDPTVQSDWDAIYLSFVNLGSFTYDDKHATSPQLKLAMAAQLLSGITLLICALPLLVSRLTDLDSEIQTVAKADTPVSVFLHSGEACPIKSASLTMTNGPELKVVLGPGIVPNKTDSTAGSHTP
jgi:hypothetical protein